MPHSRRDKQVVLFACLLVGCVVAVRPILVAYRPQVTEGRNEAATWLDAYSTGRYGEALQGLLAVDDVRRFGRRYVGDADQWIERGDRGVREWRSRVAATLLLELIRTTLDRSRQAYTESRYALEVYCRRFRDAPPSEFEKVWMLASVALAQGAYDEELLLGPLRGGRRDLRAGHVSHVRERYPDDGRLALAAVGSYDGGRITVLPSDAVDVRAVREPDGSYRRVAVVQASDDTIRALQRLADDDQVGGEASLRLGIIHFQSGVFPEAISYLSKAAAVQADPHVAYLGHLFLGRVHEAVGRPDAAVRAYREAVRVVPGAHSAAVSLAAALFLAGKVDDASDVMKLATGNAVPDPWRAYSLRDLRFWPQYQARLRDMLEHSGMRR
jgi:tetratricopeptide (TPR) repeat protein